MMDFVLKMFSRRTGHPPRQRNAGRSDAARRQAGAQPYIAFDSCGPHLEPGRVTRKDGAAHEADAVIVATDGPTAHKLLGEHVEAERQEGRCVLRYYFDAPEDPVRKPILVLNGDDNGLINNLAVVSNTSPSLAPRGRHLISGSVGGSRITNPYSMTSATSFVAGMDPGRTAGGT